MQRKAPRTGAFLWSRWPLNAPSVAKKSPALCEDRGLVRSKRLTALLLRRGFFIKTKPRFRIAEVGDFYPAHFVQAQWA
jgi:hypothetical protein